MSAGRRSRRAHELTDAWDRSFAKRIAEHVNDGSPPGSAPFAARMAIRATRESGYEDLPSNTDWWKQRNLPPEGRTAVAQALLEHFGTAKAQIGAMGMRVLPLDDDAQGVRSTIVAPNLGRGALRLDHSACKKAQALGARFATTRFRRYWRQDSLVAESRAEAAVLRS